MIPKILLIVSFALFTLIVLNVQTVEGSGVGSPAACVNDIEGTSNEVTYTVPSGEIITGVCIKSGANMFNGNKHSQVLTNGDYESGCYTVSGIGTSTVTVVRNGSGSQCQGISHIDVITGSSTPTGTPTPTPTSTPTNTPTPTPTPTSTSTPTNTPTQPPTSTNSPTPTPTETPTPTDTSKPTPTETPTVVPTPKMTPGFFPRTGG